SARNGTRNCGSTQLCPAYRLLDPLRGCPASGVGGAPLRARIGQRWPQQGALLPFVAREHSPNEGFVRHRASANHQQPPCSGPSDLPVCAVSREYSLTVLGQRAWIALN